MRLENYVLNGPSVVIADDERDPFISWQHHIDRAGRGGVDLVAPVGTPVYAPTPGTFYQLPENGGAGNSGRLLHDANAGWSDVFSHLSSYVVASGTHVDQGALLAYSGDTGGVTPHLHRHLEDAWGRRHNPWDYLPPVEIEKELPDMDATQDKRLKIVEQILGVLQNDVHDPKIGILKTSNDAAASAERARRAAEDAVAGLARIQDLLEGGGNTDAIASKVFAQFLRLADQAAAPGREVQGSA